MNKNNISIKEIKEIELNILNQLSDFCDKNGLDYSLCGGTLLGAVRHKGFIPWDDDIDVFVPRKTYEVLCKKFNKWGRKKNLKLINYFCNGYYSTFAKIIDTRTSALEEKRNEKIGIWVDLFIVDSMKSNDKSFSEPIVNYLKEIRFFGSEDYFANKNPLLNIKKALVRIIKKPIYRKNIESFIRNNSGEYDVSYSFADQIGWWKKMGKLDFEHAVFLEFEGKKYKVIANWKDYLVCRYGPDYMTPPPESQRESHPLKKCEWKK